MPKGSHASGIWKKAILGESLVDKEVLATVLTEVESTVNSRPLPSASDDPSIVNP